MSMVTTWGYIINDADKLPDLLTPIEYDAMTANKFLGDGRTPKAISAASSAIRNYCGWHIFPEKECVLSENILYGNGRMKPVGSDLLIQLPATLVTGISSVMIGVNELPDFALETNGLLHVFDVPRIFMNRKTKITVTYTAGCSEDQIAVIKDIIGNQVLHSMSNSMGIQSETAGGVSITYSANYQNAARANHITEDSKEALTPYRVQGVF